MMARQTRDTRRTVGHHAELTMLCLNKQLFFIGWDSTAAFFGLLIRVPGQWTELLNASKFRCVIVFQHVSEVWTMNMYTNIYVDVQNIYMKKCKWTWNKCTIMHGNKHIVHERKHQHLYGQNAEVKSCKYMVFDSHLTIC